METFSADQMREGQTTEIMVVKESEFALKLMEMGILPGKKLTRLYTAPLGDPIAFQLDHTTIALRKAEAKDIQVKGQK